MKKIGIIGGSGLENLELTGKVQNLVVNTPYGSVPLKIISFSEKEIVILSRHGINHIIPPTQINFRANIFALKEYGCDCVLATTAVGSLREEIKRGDLVILDQFIDFTKHRLATFYESFEPNKPVHTAMADPFSVFLREKLIENCQKLNFSFHKKGTVVTIEGPRFSTRAESKMFKMWGAEVINMSTAPEVILCNEVGLPYASVAMSTDYDCWKEDEEQVSWEGIAKIFGENVKKVTDLLEATILSLE
ncbi:MAG: Purine nucleoside phosphorylase [Candidatus Magasanikbacteria bacterium GW2011_GWC2_37_14]|uniref:Purine nucleoside phosphorylase n=1 Tax=Candidatus Magasanikbacteria bacterium GW2011_GWC2_37_14 TaxID=1619046 RepID=A0A0G0IUR5_9BACT|nr:MAG: Purine nucleoside phosphorylase [Candidatus Magasanikbacteria bacterium GW2011_GWC2_37_14]